MKQTELEKTEKNDVILVHFQWLSEGFDCREPLDTIIWLLQNLTLTGS